MSENTLKLKNLKKPMNYYVISYDLRVDNMDSEVDDKMIQEVLAILLVLSKCPDIKCYVESTVHFSSIKDFKYWFDLIKNYFEKHVTFVLDQIKVEENIIMHEVYYNPNYTKKYKTILENNYDNLILELRKEKDEDLGEALAIFAIKE